MAMTKPWGWRLSGVALHPIPRRGSADGSRVGLTQAGPRSCVQVEVMSAPQARRHRDKFTDRDDAGPRAFPVTAGYDLLL